jgi:hypothetical protein
MDSSDMPASNIAPESSGLTFPTRVAQTGVSSGPGSGTADERIVVTSEQDPFGLLPPNWPESIALQPDAKIAESGVYAMTGLYLIALISSDRATPAGVQGFYIESLSDWETLQVREDPTGVGLPPNLTVIAERPGAEAQVTAGTGSADFMSTLHEKEYWIHLMGSRPVVIWLYYRPKP